MWNRKSTITHAATAKIKQFVPQKYSEIAATLNAMAETAQENGETVSDDWWNKKLSLPPECLKIIDEAGLGGKTKSCVVENVGRHQLAQYAEGKQPAVEELIAKAEEETTAAKNSPETYLSANRGFGGAPPLTSL